MERMARVVKGIEAHLDSAHRRTAVDSYMVLVIMLVHLRGSSCCHKRSQPSCTVLPHSPRQAGGVMNPLQAVCRTLHDS